ncbi:hypothetical protein HanXRQr2_Chr14g0635431 [Helianthus annuus]|uniref:Uncharacterized protein n=1 Tax=Helianthus annuus TaxID=4232 RepID=A0A251SG43_HELAN|nr:hypothetical protein HanXRQr2_Chr14g0635431 [Helianthus annuus]KAJ0839657.1 hypothetical protein HanPSC8_Chr14g0609431 [Helianthus annuus]
MSRGSPILSGQLSLLTIDCQSTNSFPSLYDHDSLINSGSILHRTRTHLLVLLLSTVAGAHHPHRRRRLPLPKPRRSRQRRRLDPGNSLVQRHLEQSSYSRYKNRNAITVE